MAHELNNLLTVIQINTEFLRESAGENSVSAEELDALLIGARGLGTARWLTEHAPIRTRVPGHGDKGIPDRLARALCQQARRTSGP